MDHLHPATSNKRSARAPADLLRDALAAYGLNRRRLRQLASQPVADLRAALRDPDPPAELLALLDLQAALLTPTRREPISGPADVAALLMLRMGHLDQEQLITICLDQRNCVQEIALVYQGSVDRAVVRIAEVFKPALRRNSCALIVVHNHPAGTLDPSLDDLDLTDSCIQMGKQLDIALIDHLIIGAGRWVSVRTWVERRAEFTAQKQAA
ncbi:MAG: JAB domain-containing protein [Roseiflexaceae bacterium]